MKLSQFTVFAVATAFVAALPTTANAYRGVAYSPQGQVVSKFNLLSPNRALTKALDECNRFYGNCRGFSSSSKNNIILFRCSRNGRVRFYHGASRNTDVLFNQTMGRFWQDGYTERNCVMIYGFEGK